MRCFIASLIIILASPLTAGAAEESTAPNVSMGIMGTGGIGDVYTQSSGKHMNWERGPMYGGGFLFEKMFSNSFGVQSGLFYAENLLSFTETDYSSGTGEKVTYDLKSRGIGMPLYLVTSFNSTSVSLNLLAGFSLFHVLDSKLTFSGAGKSGTRDILIYVNENQVALSGGIMFKFRAWRFADLFIGGIADFNVLNLLSDNARDDETINYPYAFRGVAGIMLRTNIFPARER